MIPQDMMAKQVFAVGIQVGACLFNKEAYEKTTVGDLMHQPPATVGISDTMEQVMDKFENSMAWNLPVLDKANRYLGFVSKSSIFNEYRRSLIDRSKD